MECTNCDVLKEEVAMLTNVNTELQNKLTRIRVAIAETKGCSGHCAECDDVCVGAV